MVYVLESNQSSESTKLMYLPEAYFKPIFLADPAPPFGLLSIVIRGSFLEYSLRIFKELSVDPSLMQIISMSLNV